MIKLQQLNPSGISLPPLPEIPPSTLIDDLTTLYNDQDLSDFKIVARDQPFRTHLFILIARSQVGRSKK